MKSQPRPGLHRAPGDRADRFALVVTRLLRLFADTFFAKRYGHRPIALERFLILVAQWTFCMGYFLLYLVSRRTAHRLVGYFEEEAVLSYTLYLAEIDAGRVPDVAAPAIARRYWKLAEGATLSDVVRVVRADEAHHRDVNHGLADLLSGQPVDPAPVAPYPPHADSTR